MVRGRPDRRDHPRPPPHQRGCGQGPRRRPDDGCRHPRPGDPLPRRATPLLGRDAAAHRYRRCARQQSAASHCRRADDSARRHDPGPGAATNRSVKTGPRHDRGPHYPRPRRRGTGLRPGGRHARGRLLEVAATRDLFKRPTHPYTRALLAANPAGTPRGTRLPVIPAEWSVESLQNSEAARIRSADAPREISRD